MSPLDDELRTALHTRADLLAPSPDPLAGIETRARGMRRRRSLAAVTGAALMVVAVALAVPLVGSGGTAAPQPASTVSTSDAVLDPAHPWAFRGTALASPDALKAAWKAKHPDSTLAVLFAQVYEPSGQGEAFFVAGGPSGARYGYAIQNDSGTVIDVDQPLATGTTALTYTLEGDETQRLLVLAAPSTRAIEYAADGATYAPMTAIAGPGVAVTSLDNALNPRVRVLGSNGAVVYDAPLKDNRTLEPGPTNLLSWPARGSQDSSLLAPARAALAPSLQATPDEVLLQVLFTGDTDSAVRYVMGQAWKRGDASAHSFAYAEGGTNGPSTFFGPVTPDAPALLAFVVDSLPGTTTDLLVVVPTPRTTQVSYGTDRSHVRPVADTPGTDGVALIDRSRTPGEDVLVLLTGNGGPADVTFNGPVAPLLCGDKSCG